MQAVQLGLELDDARVRIPWSGQSPRALTRAAKMLYSRREPQKSMRDLLLMGQLELEFSIHKVPPLWGGTHSLLPLEERGDDLLWLEEEG